MVRDDELVVIGSGPAGQKAAINAAKLGKRVAVIERAGMVGGVSVHGGTIPSKTLRDAILYLTGFNEDPSMDRTIVSEIESVGRRLRVE
jgi:NAD(P) transhydrogenase